VGGDFLAGIVAQIEKLSLCHSSLEKFSLFAHRKRQLPPFLGRLNEGFKSFGEFFSLSSPLR
jgi:hypothetical protein